MRFGKLDMWMYRNKTRHSWFGRFTYSGGRLHHIALGPVVLVVDYR